MDLRKPIIAALAAATALVPVAASAQDARTSRNAAADRARVAATQDRQSGIEMWRNQQQRSAVQQQSQQRRDDRQDSREDRRDYRRDTRQDNRTDRNDNRQDRRTDNRDYRQDRRDDTRDYRQDRRTDNRDYRQDRRGDNRERYNDWRDEARYRQGWDDRRSWNRSWQNDRRYNWRYYRERNRNLYRMPRYYSPRGWGYGYRRFSIGVTLSSLLFSPSYWINEPYRYHLPPVYGPYRWVRYYDDAVLVDIRTGRVVDVIYDIFW